MSDESVGAGAPDAGWRADGALAGALARTVEGACFRLDAERRLRAVTEELVTLTGRSREELLGEHVSVLFEPPDEARLEIALRRLEAGEAVVKSIAVRITADGEAIPCSLRLGRVDPNAESSEVVGVIRTRATPKTEDGSTDERSEQARRLERERDLFEQVLDAAPIDIKVVDRDGEVIRTNAQREIREFADVTDYDIYTVDGEPIPVAERPSRRVFETGEPVYDEEVCVDRPDGDRRYISVSAVPLTDDDGEVDRAVVTVEDVTHLKAQARRLERQRDAVEAELEGVYDRVTDAFFALDCEWRFTHVNDRTAEVFGRPAEEMIGEHIWTRFDELAGTDFQAEYERAMETQEQVSFEAYFEPQEAWYAVEAYPSDSGLSVYFRDVTERKERERALAESRRRYRGLVENFPNGVVTLFDEEMRILVAGGEGFAGYPFEAEDIEGERLEDAAPSELYEQVNPHYEAVLDGEERSFEVTFGERTLQFHSVPIRDDEGRVTAGMGMSQDVTEQHRRERELQTRVRQQSAVTGLGQRALEADDLDALFSTAVSAIAATLDTDSCKVLDLTAEGDELLLRAGVGWRDELVGQATVGTDRDSQAGYTLLSKEPVVVQDLTTEDRFTGPELLSSHDVRSGVSVVIGTPQDPWGVLAAHDSEAREFSRQDVEFVQAMANILTTAVERIEQEGELRRQREQLAALNRLNEISRDIIRALLQQSTREEVEQLVCDRLADSDSYAFAWVGALDEQSEEVVVETEAGVTDYLDDATIRIDDSDAAQGPTGKAFKTGEFQASRNVLEDPDYARWRDRGKEYGYRSSAAVPISHENTIYGVLNVYTERVDAFDTEERAVLRGLGEVMGHAINAIERERLLMSDEVTEVEIRLQSLFDDLDIEADVTGSITISETIPTGDGAYLAYGTATEAAQPALEALVERETDWGDLTYLESDAGDRRFEVVLEDPPILRVLSSHGGHLDRVRISDGDVFLTMELPPDAPVRAVVDGVESVYSDAEMLAQRRTTHSGRTGGRAGFDLEALLTDRQAAAVEAAYHAGFFEWPRERTGEEVAASLGIAPPTFHQHLRTAQRHVFEALLEDDEQDQP
ncbi:PAS domain-containing protein [Halorientalis halophila]|uniref:PAS domain-containing protein n=1 Tax=Halorientalis halophila TaxID=3108499 RepID=UPI003009D51A